MAGAPPLPDGTDEVRAYRHWGSSPRLARLTTLTTVCSIDTTNHNRKEHTMYDFENEREIVGYAYDTNGIATHAASIIPDPEPMILMEGLASQFSDAGLKANIRIVREPSLAHLLSGYYELERGTRLDEAW